MDADVEFCLKFLKGVMLRRLTPRRAFILLLTSREKAVRNGDVIKALRVSNSLITGDTKALVDGGFMREKPSPKDEDGRHKLYELTRLGLSAVADLTTRS